MPKWQQAVVGLVTCGARLIERAQAASLGGRSGPRGLEAPPSHLALNPEHWDQPFLRHRIPLQHWVTPDWLCQATGQVLLGGGRKSCHEFFQLAPDLHCMSMASGRLLRHHPDALLLRQLLETTELSIKRSRCIHPLPCPYTHGASAHLCKGAERLEQAFQEANAVLHRREGIAKLGALSCAHLCCGRLWIAQVGPLHLFRWRQGRLTTLSQQTNQSTRFLGLSPDLALSVHSEQVEVGDLYFFCSSSLLSALSPQILEQVVEEHRGQSDLICERLIDMVWSARRHHLGATLSILQIANHRHPPESKTMTHWHSEMEDALFS